MPDYRQGKIYKIECNLTNDVYYGSTVESLSKRMSNHKTNRDCRATNIIDRGNFTCKVVEYCPCTTKRELETRERWWIENNQCINIIIPTRTIQEWYQDNKDKMKEYREDNKKHIKEYDKKYRDDNKQYFNEYNKKYRENNKQYFKEYDKKYRDDNKDKINEKFTCECGGKYTRRHRLQHCRSKKHLEYISDK